jgi:hypothetical protein
MRRIFGLLYGSVPAEFESRFGLQESVEKLSAARQRFVLFPTKRGAVGRVSKDRVWLRRPFPAHDAHSGMSFSGTFRERDGRVMLSGRFTVNWFMKALMTAWLGVCLWAFLMGMLHPVVGPGTYPDVWLAPLVAVVALAMGATVLWAHRWSVRSDMRWLSGKIGDTLSH